MAGTATQAIDEWVRQLGERDMPVFADTARRIAALTVQDDAAVTELVQTILRDSLMTARVLRVANSVYYQPGRGAISTVSRAVVVMGFETVRALALSVSLVESLGKGVQRERVALEVARAFHAALHAKTFAIHAGEEHPEEVYAATLLHRLGHLSFWCFGGPKAERLEALSKKGGVGAERAEREVLGFRLDDLSARLGAQWRLGETYQAAFNPDAGNDKRARSIRLGHRLARAAEAGWDNAELQGILQEIGELTRLPAEAVVDAVHGNAKNAAETARFIGGAEVGKLIPPPPEASQFRSRFVPPEAAGEGEGGAAAAVEAVEAVDPATTIRPDHRLQLEILWDLAGMLEGKLDLNVLIPTALEGIFRGIGMDRVLLALLGGSRDALKIKYALGAFDPGSIKDMELSAKPHPPNLFGYALAARKSFWAKAEPKWELRHFLTPEVLAVSRGAPFYLMPIRVDERAIGLIYADCQPSGRDLTEEGFLAFQHFGRQANLAFSLISRRGK